jgi:hypothetical protein
LLRASGGSHRPRGCARACRRALQDAAAQLLELRPLVEAAAGAAAQSGQALAASGAGPAASGWRQQRGGERQAAQQQQGPAGSAQRAELPSPSGADTPDQPPEQQQEQQQEQEQDQQQEQEQQQEQQEAQQQGEAASHLVRFVQPAALPDCAAQRQEQQQQQLQAAAAGGIAEGAEQAAAYHGLPGLLLYTSSGTSSASGQGQQQGQQQGQVAAEEAIEVVSPSRPSREQQGPPVDSAAQQPGATQQPGAAQQPAAAQRESPPPASGAQGLLLELSPPGAAPCGQAPGAQAEADAALQTLLAALAGAGGGDGAPQPERRLQVQAAMQQTSSLVAQLRAENQSLRRRVEGLAAEGEAGEQLQLQMG